ncbi:hypothetical protein [Spirosoma endbachense]|uniref:Uncharacterized protein n=1 Tax=Spirosoma endbachense TaxID=2666025 RepID=A0A6P1W9J7_9BACT|nr:hypothetical protein [Spirosoma endbachense]QHW00591.1 hypothetical protein GJR95_38680 [Spirosoma endbachense]
MKANFLFFALLLSYGSFAQQADSAKVQPKESKNPSGLAKYKENGRFQSQLNVGSSTATSGQTPALGIEKPKNQRVESSYQYDNGRVTGGKTTLKFGKKH